MSAKVVDLRKRGRKDPPHSIEAEQSVLGGLMLNNAVYKDVAAKLKDADFYRSDHQLIFRAIGELITAGKSCDFVTLSEHLRNQGRLDEAGGVSYLGSLAVDTYSVANLLAYAGIVRERALLRDIIEAGRAFMGMGFSPEGRSARELVEEAQEKLDEISMSVLADDGVPADALDGLHPTLADLVQHYVLVYGTDTVWDERRGCIELASAVRMAAGGKRAEKWLQHPRRRTVDKRNLVFDPSCKTGDGMINMFRGWPLKPKAGECGKLLDLLTHLCSHESGGDDNPMADWVLDWLAFPLQHPGAKMQSALLFHGPAGVGKNLLFRAIRAIYGQYCTEIGQAQLEFFRFNGWGSRKLLVIGNEVISRTELKHAEGQLRQWITEPTWQVDEKNLPLREEENHANFIFLSNFIVPMSLGHKDRRFAVLWTPPPLDESFYQAVAAELDAGGAAAFYELLMRRELHEFNEHTKPPMTQAKQDLMEASADSYTRFADDWLAGTLPVLAEPAAPLDLYRAYERFCRERGERNPVKAAMFWSAMKKRVHSSRTHKYRLGQVVHEGVLYIPKPLGPVEDRFEQDVLGEFVADFRGRLKVWMEKGEGGEG